jgi:hypothetical protein
MKKKLFAMLSLVAVLAMESVTVFATETTPSSNTRNVETYNVLTGATDGTGVSVSVTANADGTFTAETSSGTKLEFKSGGKILQSTSTTETSAISTDGNTQLVEMTKETIVLMASQTASVVSEMATTYGAEALSVAAVDIEGTLDANGGLTIAASNIKKGDFVYVLHYNKATSSWEKCEAVVNDDGSISVTVPSGTLSPFIIIKFDKDVTSEVAGTDYSAQTVTNTVSGDVSPKTADAEPYTAMIALISVACIAVCTKKLAKI